MKKLLPLLSVLLIISCTAPKEIIREVPVEVIKTEYKTQFVHDSTYIHDSTFIYIKGDTVYNTTTQTKYIKNTVHDTLVTHDTIPVTIKETVIEEKIVKKTQWWPVWLALGTVGLYLLVTKTKLIKYMKNFINYIINLFK